MTASMKISQVLFLWVLLPVLACGKSSPPAQEPGKPAGREVRVLAYLMGNGDNWEDAVSRAEIARVTDLVLAFFDPAANGDLVPDRAALKRAVGAARAKNGKVRIYFAIGGGSPRRTWST